MQRSLLIDVSRLVVRAGRGRLPTGVDRVCLAYLERLGHRAQAVLRWRGWCRIAPYAESQQLFALLGERRPDFLRRAAKLIARSVSRPAPQAMQGRLYVNAGHSGLGEAGLSRWLQRSGSRPVFMVHDLIPLTHPEYCRPGERDKHAARMDMLLRSGHAIIANSQTTLDQLRTFARDRQMPVPPAVAAPLAPPPLRFDPRSEPPLQQPFFVVIGTIEPRKNHWMLLHVWRELVGELGERAPHLVVIGQRGWECENVVDLLERCEPLRGKVHELSSCTDDRLASYLGHARALLFPSFAEGYGLPLVEALMLGTPAIASSLASFREVAGAVPDYLHPLDGRAWLQAVRDYAAEHHPRRLAQLGRMRDFRVPTWDEHFMRVEALLEDLA